MAKETTIIFVYDTELLKYEEQDPNSAILYFYPTWVSDQQKTALCGQIMGTVRCLKSIFSIPNIVSLQTGKFFIIENERYILAVGTDRNISDWVLEHRANLIYSLVNFFHKDFVTLARLYQNDTLSAKLYHMFDTYLKMLFFGGNIFSHIPMLSLPKSGSNVFTEAVTFLESCREFSNVLGGTILYHNKVIVTQLSIPTTKKIVISDPYRIKNPAEILETNFELPLGVQLLQIYITNKEFCGLLETSLRSRCIFQYLSNKSIRKPHPLKNQSSDSNESSQPPPPNINKSFKSGLKRDTSLLFTAVPEEDSTSPNAETSTNLSHQDYVPASQNLQKKSRPKFLNLKSSSTESNESKLSNKVTPMTPYCGQTSVASTPMTELKRFVHQNTLTLIDKKELSTDDFRSVSEDLNEPTCSRQYSNTKIEKEIRKNNLESNLHLQSPIELQNLPLDHSRKTKTSTEPSLKHNNSKEPLANQKHLKRLPFKQGSSLVSLSEVMNGIAKNPLQYTHLKNKLLLSPKKSIKLKRSKSISDPLYPIFKQDGTAASYFYFAEMLSNDFLRIRSDYIRKISSKSDESELRADQEVNVETELKKSDSKFELKLNPSEKVSKEHRKSLTLPLKPLNSSEPQKADRRFSTGVQLTPLMSKLTMLAFEEQKNAGKETALSLRTPYGMTPSKEQFNFNFKSKEVANLRLEGDNVLQKCILFVCGQQDVVLTLLLKEECSKDKDTIEQLWELCTEHLPKLEKQLNFCLETQNSGTAPQESEPYSYLCLDKQWDTIKRGGPWNTSDLNVLYDLHGDFEQNSDITEIFLRNYESVIYGHHIGTSEIFYHENAPMAKGLLPPSDAIGQVQLKARRRLERDHQIVLL